MIPSQYRENIGFREIKYIGGGAFITHNYVEVIVGIYMFSLPMYDSSNHFSFCQSRIVASVNIMISCFILTNHIKERKIILDISLF